MLKLRQTDRTDELGRRNDRARDIWSGPHVVVLDRAVFQVADLVLDLLDSLLDLTLDGVSVDVSCQGELLDDLLDVRENRGASPTICVKSPKSSAMPL